MIIQKIPTEICQEEYHTVQKYEYQYEYDDVGNWIKKSFIVNGKLFTTTTRQIEYYK